MAGYNRIIMVGNLTRDPELKQLPSGQSVCRLGIASNRSYKNRQTGMNMQEVCYVDVDVWGAQANSCQQYLAKGRSVLVEGRLRLDTWQDPQGANRSKHSITADRVVFLSSASDSSEYGADDYEESSSKGQFATQNTPEFAKVEQELEKKKAEKKQAKSGAATKEVKNDDAMKGVPEFKDEPPFEDELPF